mmetsp:Transcript_37466/g.99587  ORF Transcript_37466/g.99587 Transcript_37466/m.99587 type:complete len:104 (+) Transcript_37466:315-626(+)
MGGVAGDEVGAVLLEEFARHSGLVATRRRFHPLVTSTTHESFRGYHDSGALSARDAGIQAGPVVGTPLPVHLIILWTAMCFSRQAKSRERPDHMRVSSSTFSE